MVAAGVRFTAERPGGVSIRRKPNFDAVALSQIEQGDEIVAAEVFIEQGIEWVKLLRGAKATRVNGKSKQIVLNLREDGFVPTQDPLEGLLLRKHTDVIVQEKKEEGVLTKAEIAEILEKSSDPNILLPLESKLWSKQQLEMFVMSGGTIRPKWCSVPDERLMANINMSKDEVMHALTQAADWISNADAILIGSGAGMGVDSGLGTFRGGQKGVWAGLEAVGLAYEEICVPKWFEEEPHLGWAFWDYCHQAYQATTPHEGYTQAREWAQRCPLGFFSFTSNIDSHWITSGTRAEHVLEVHGAVRWLQCSKPCSQDVWKAPKDLGLQEDPVTHRVRGILPTCPKCKAVARPNVQMFGGDTGFSKARRTSQFSRYDAWLKKLEARPDKDVIRITCLEVGCGLTVPTVRKELEAVVRKFPGARIIRVNPENPGLTQELTPRGVSLPMRAGAAIQEIGKQVVTDEDKVTFIMWGEEGGVEIRAPYGTCLGRLLRMAEMEEGISVDFSMETIATTRPGFAAKGELVRLDWPVPVSAFAEVKAAEGAAMQVTTVLGVGAKFRNVNDPRGMNSLLAKRVEQVSSLLDDMNQLFREEEYQQEVRKCADRRSVMRMARTVHFQVLPKYGIDATDRGPALMAAFIGSGQNTWEIQMKVDESMDLSYVKHMSHLPAVDSPAKKKKQDDSKQQQPQQQPQQQRQRQRQRQQQQQQQQQPTQQPQQQGVQPEAGPQAAPHEVSEEPQPAQPLEVTVSTVPSEDKDIRVDTLSFSLTTLTTVAELRQRLQESLGWSEEGTKAARFMAKINGNSYGGLKDAECVRRVVYVHGGPGLRPPEPIDVAFTEMAPDDGEKAKIFHFTVMTDDTVTNLRKKLKDALGWDERTQKRAKFLIKLNSGSFGALKEHEKVHLRKTIFVHAASLVPPVAATPQEGPHSLVANAIEPTANAIVLEKEASQEEVSVLAKAKEPMESASCKEHAESGEQKPLAESNKVDHADPVAPKVPSEPDSERRGIESAKSEDSHREHTMSAAQQGELVDSPSTPKPAAATQQDLPESAANKVAEAVEEKEPTEVRATKEEERNAAPQRPVEERVKARAKKEVPDALPRQVEEQTWKPEPKARQSEPVFITLTILGTQDDAHPDSTTVVMRLDSTVGDLRRKVAEKLQLSEAGAAAVKFIFKSASNFGTMRDTERVKEQIYVRGIGTLQLNPKRGPAPFEEEKTIAAAPDKAPILKRAVAPENVDVTVVLERTVNYRVPIRVRKESTIWQIKEKLVAVDPAGTTNPKQFGLAPFKKDSPSLKAFSDNMRISYSCTLEIVAPPDEEVPKRQRVSPPPGATAPPPSEPLTVVFTRLTTLEDPRPQRFDVACMTTSKISEVRRRVADACKLDDRAAGRVKILFRVVGGNGFMTAKENEFVVKEMFLHNIDMWPGD